MEGLKRYSMIGTAGGFAEYESESGEWVRFDELEEKIKELSDFYGKQQKQWQDKEGI